MATQPFRTFHNGQTIPQLGFGTWQLEGQKAYEATKTALQVGYRHVDTADRYGNHQAVGQALADSGLPREAIFLTSKLWHADLAPAKAKAALERNLTELQTTYLDLYLIHWPNRNVPIADTLATLEELVQEGRIRSYGVSNFTIHHLQDALDAGFQPVTNQVEFHPSLNQAELKTFADKHNIVLTAYSPIAQGHDLQLPVIQAIAADHQRSTAQVVLNWLRQKGLVAIPRSADESHIKDNFACLEWELSPEEMAAIDQLNENYRIVKPDFNEFGY